MVPQCACGPLLPLLQKKRSELLAIIRERNLTHPTVKSFSYKSFQQCVLQFLKSYVDDSEPLLLTVRVGPAWLTRIHPSTGL